MLGRLLWGFAPVGLSLLALGCDVPPPSDAPEEVETVVADLSTSAAYTLTAVNSGLCVDVTGASTVDGANVEQWTCNGQENQQWTLHDTGGGLYTLTSVGSGKCLDVAGANTATGGNVDQSTCHGSTNQLWRATSLGSNRYTLTSVGSGKCLDVAGSSTVRGGNVQQWTCNGHTSQQFTFSTSSVGGAPVASTGGGTSASAGKTTGNFPARFAAPYVPTWNDTDLVALSKATGNQFWTLAFVINGSGRCTPTWNGDTSLTGNNYGKYISALKAAGGDVIVSFGGESGTEIAASCSDVAGTQAAYQKVISQFHLSWIDLDIESGQESDSASVDRRNKALHNLQAANPGLHVSYTLAVDRTGLESAQRNLLTNARSNGVDVNVVNIMAMDYGPCYSDMGQAAVDAANATRSQLTSIGLSSKVGVTPIIGTNDVSCEKFSTSDADVLVKFAQANSFVGLLAYWEQTADSSHSYIKIFKTFH